MVTLNDTEVAVLDEHRGPLPRAVFLRRLVHEPPKRPDVATRSEAMALLSELARERRTQAVIALARELREGGDREVFDWILEGD